MSATPLRVYLIRSVIDWALDAGFTPHLLVDAATPGVSVPPGSANEGRVVLNVHPQAVHGFGIADDEISFSARFSGRAFPIRVPVDAVIAVYARENGEGLALPAAPAKALEGDETPPPAPKSPAKGGRPALKVVK